MIFIKEYLANPSFKNQVYIFFINLFLVTNCLMTEKQACYHDIKLDGGSKSNLECLIFPLYYESILNDPRKSEEEKKSLTILKNDILINCAEDTLKAEKCKRESNYKLTIRS